MLPMAAARSSSGTLTIGRIAYHWGGVFFPTANALYSIAFGIHVKTAEPIDMPFGMMSGLVPTNIVLRGGDDPQSGSGILGENVPNKPITATNCDFGYEGPISLKFTYLP